MIASLLGGLWRGRFVLSLLIVVLCIPTVYLYWILETDNSVDIWYNKDNPQKLTYDRFTQIFEGDETILIAYQNQDLFLPDQLQFLQTLVEPLEELPEIISIRTITNSERMLTDNEELLEIRSLYDQFGENFSLSQTDQDQTREQMTADRLYRGNVISPDGTIGVLVLQVPRMSTEDKGVIVEKVWKIVTRVAQDKRIYYSGAPVLDAKFDQISQRDHQIFVTLSFIMLFIALIFLFRRFSFSVVPLLVVGATAIITMGIYFLVGLTNNMITNILAPLLLSIGIADSVHILTHFNQLRRKGMKRIEAARQSLNDMALPCFLTSITTGLGFASFVTSSVVPIRNLGMFAAIGIFLALVISLVAIPGFLSNPWLKPSKKFNQKKDPLRIRVLLALLNKNADFVNRYRKWIFWSLPVTVLLAIAAASQVTVDTTPLEFFKENNPVRQDAEFLNDNFSGVSNIEYLLEGSEDAFKNPDILNAMIKAQNFAESIPEVTASMSIADYIRELHRAFQSGRQEDYRIPDSSDAVAQLLLLYELGNADELYKMVTRDFAIARITLRLITKTSSQGFQIMTQITEKLKEEMQGIGQGQLKIRPTGITPLYIELDEFLLKSQIRSMALALFTVFFCMWALLRKGNLALLAMVPNTLPIILTLGVMGLMGIYLDVATVMIGSIALGIAVDDTIHFLVRFRREVRALRQRDADLVGDPLFVEAIRNSLTGVGTAIIFTSIILFCGFSILALGNYRPTIYFGALTSLTMVFAIFGDLIVLPALLLVLRPYLEKDI